MSGHKHAALMAEYAKDAAETDKPWERWEWYGQISNKWRACNSHPTWDENSQFRRKPRPLEAWVNFYQEHDAGFAHTTEAEAREVAGSDARRVAVHMREVIKDE